MTAENDVVLARTEGHVTTWTLNLPESRNPISGDEVVDRLVELVAARQHRPADAGGDPDRCGQCVLRGRQRQGHGRSQRHVRR